MKEKKVEAGTFLWKGASRPMHVGVNTLRFMEGR